MHLLPTQRAKIPERGQNPRNRKSEIQDCAPHAPPEMQHGSVAKTPHCNCSVAHCISARRVAGNPHCHAAFLVFSPTPAKLRVCGVSPQCKLWNCGNICYSAPLEIPRASPLPHYFLGRVSGVGGATGSVTENLTLYQFNSLHQGQINNEIVTLQGVGAQPRERERERELEPTRITQLRLPT